MNFKTDSFVYANGRVKHYVLRMKFAFYSQFFLVGRRVTQFKEIYENYALENLQAKGYLLKFRLLTTVTCENLTRNFMVLSNKHGMSTTIITGHTSVTL